MTMCQSDTMKGWAQMYFEPQPKCSCFEHALDLDKVVCKRRVNGSSTKKFQTHTASPLVLSKCVLDSVKELYLILKENNNEQNNLVVGLIKETINNNDLFTSLVNQKMTTEKQLLSKVSELIEKLTFLHKSLSEKVSKVSEKQAETDLLKAIAKLLETELTVQKPQTTTK